MDRRPSHIDRLNRDLGTVVRLLDSAFRRQDGPDRRTRAVAILVWFLSRSPALAVMYLQSRSSVRIRSEDFYQDTEVAALTMLDWFGEPSTRDVVFAAIDSMDHTVRVLADTFLMMTCLVDYIVAQNQRGVTVPFTHAVEVYLRLWSHRPVSARSGLALRRLAWNRNSRRRFGQELRRSFMLSNTALLPARELKRDDLVLRVTPGNIIT